MEVYHHGNKTNIKSRPKIQEGMILLRGNLKTDCLTFSIFP